MALQHKVALFTGAAPACGMPGSDCAAGRLSAAASRLFQYFRRKAAYSCQLHASWLAYSAHAARQAGSCRTLRTSTAAWGLPMSVMTSASSRKMRARSCMLGRQPRFARRVTCSGLAGLRTPGRLMAVSSTCSPHQKHSVQLSRPPANKLDATQAH